MNNIPEKLPIKGGKNLALFGMILGISSLLFAIVSSLCGTMCAAASIDAAGASNVAGAYGGATVLSFLGLLAALTGLILSVLGMKKLKLENQPAALAVVGLILSIIGIVYSFFGTICNLCLCAAGASVGV